MVQQIIKNSYIYTSTVYVIVFPFVFMKMSIVISIYYTVAHSLLFVYYFLEFATNVNRPIVLIHIHTGRGDILSTRQNILRRVQNILYIIFLCTKNIYLLASRYTAVTRVYLLYLLYIIIYYYIQSLSFFLFGISREFRKTTVTVWGAVAWGGTGPPAVDVRLRAVGINAYRRAPRARTP